MRTLEHAKAVEEEDDPRLFVELGCWSLLIALLNLPLFFGAVNVDFVLTQDALSGRTLWAWFTHPFVHVSLYHLFLDAGAFLALYSLLSRFTLWGRFVLVVVSALGSLVAALTAGALVHADGFCGLSGVAHGLMAVAGLDLAYSPDRRVRWMGWMCLVLVLGKSMVEAVSGVVVFDLLHAGSVGTPIAACHAGGVLGGLVFWLANRAFHPQGRAE